MRSLTMAAMALSLAACTATDLETASTNAALISFDKACTNFAAEVTSANNRIEAIPPKDRWLPDIDAVEDHAAWGSDICAKTDNPGLRTMQIKSRISLVQQIDGLP